MSKPSNLIPNLNEIMEEYVEIEEEVVQEVQSGAMQEEERLEARTETEQPTEEIRKRKRGAEEAEIEYMNEKVRDFVSDKAFILWEKNLKDWGFIFERGFNKFISPFIEMFEKRGLQLLSEHKTPGFVALVKEFYANMVGVKGKMVCVKGKWISFNREKINESFNLKEQKDGSKFKKLLKGARVSENCRLANRWEGEMEFHKEESP